jgi:tetratricopeptide (TPR) repeat protein
MSIAAAVLVLALAAPDDAATHVRRGLEHHDAGRYTEAISAFDQAAALGMNAPMLHYRRARALARAGRVDDAATALQAAARGGFAALEMVEKDADLAAVRATAGWTALRTALDRNLRPCAYTPEFRALDFWVGEWDVVNAGAPPGAPSARSRIERVEDECVIQEVYTTSVGYSGRSLNIFDRESKRWQQFYVDNKGGLHHYVGEARDGQLVYLADSVVLGPPGTPAVKVRMTFSPKGEEVRQLMEQSSDGGKTWTVAFDGTYRRRR